LSAPSSFELNFSIGFILAIFFTKTNNPSSVIIIPFNYINRFKNSQTFLIKN